MRNDRDDKYDGSDNSEYHFSDDDHYESDTNANKQTAVGHDAVVDKAGKSKRLYIAMGVFVVLIGVVYKMVTPSSNIPSTEIMPQQSPVAANQNGANQNTAQAAQPVTPPPAQPVATQAPPTPPPVQSVDATPVQPATSVPPAPTTQPQSATGAPTASDLMQQAMNNPAAAAPQTQPAPPAPVQATPAAPVMPDVMAVQPPPSAVTVVNAPAPDAQMMDAAAAQQMSVDTKKIEADMQAEYNKKLAQFQDENKILQDQLQILSSRVALLDSKMSQLVTTLTQQYQGQGGSQPMAAPTPQAGSMPSAMNLPAPSAAPAEQAGPPPRIPYIVTAIIPGRAWLRSTNGDTLTVAEGDQIKGAGRVTKIDPYDGVIVIEVAGGKTVSLSYGSGS